MRTAIVSDLHLGSAFGEDLLRDAEIRRVLLGELVAAERVVLLGDVLELRETPLAAALESARPFFEELGEAMSGRPVVLVPGNHDYRLAEPLLERHALAGNPLTLEQRTEPTGEAWARIAAWLGGAELQIAYPGVWLRDDVYATHGHYMDCHMTLPRLECIAAAVSMRALGPLPAPRTEPADYERVLRPVYGLTFGVAQGGAPRSASRPSERAWRAMTTRNGRGSRARRTALRAALGAAVPATIWGINRLLRADFEATLTSSSISRSGIAAATELARRLDIDAGHVITGHTHRGGPEENDAEWPLPGGGRLHNTGSWVFASAFHHPGTPPGPYWPGTVTWLEDEGPPRRTRLLLERPRDELRGMVSRLTTTVR
jgi:UDP-2,3-diacylglucosamine pyrophosphatase LpxH